MSKAGGLGLIGSGSMHPEVLREHIGKCREATDKPFGVNIPLIYPAVQDHIQVVLDENVRIVFTSAGDPKSWTKRLKDNGINVVHVVSSTRFACKSEEAGVDAIVAEGFEAGGHNGKEETTTLCLIPDVVRKVKIPVIAAGGIASGKSMLAVMVLGAEAVQVGSRFAASSESSAHIEFKKKIIDLREGDTTLALKKLVPVRLIKNEFYELIRQEEDSGADPISLKKILGTGRSKKGMFEGNLIDGELEIGQVSSMIDQIEPASVIIKKIWDEFLEARGSICAEMILPYHL